MSEVRREESIREERHDDDATLHLSVVIVSWNTRDLLRDCLKSVYDTIEGIDCEIIVVDNNSSDATLAMVEKEFPQVRLIANDENLGYAAANNQGMFAAKGEYILCLNPDTVVLPGSINKVVGFLDSNLDYAVAGCRVKSLDGTYQTAVAKLFSPTDKFVIYGFCYYLYKAGIIKTHPYDRVKYSDEYLRADGTVDYMIGAFIMIRRQVLDIVGGLDPEFFFCVDDLDWGLRINKAGLKIKHLMDCEILHLANQSGKQVDRFSTEFQGSAYFWAKHYGLPGKLMFGYFKLNMLLRDYTVRVLDRLRLAKLRHIVFAGYMLFFLPMEIMIILPLEIKHRRLVNGFPGA